MQFLCSVRLHKHADNPLRDLPRSPTDPASAPYLREIRPDVPGIFAEADEVPRLGRRDQRAV